MRAPLRMPMRSYGSEADAQRVRALQAEWAQLAQRAGLPDAGAEPPAELPNLKREVADLSGEVRAASLRQRARERAARARRRRRSARAVTRMVAEEDEGKDEEEGAAMRGEGEEARRRGATAGGAR